MIIQHFLHSFIGLALLFSTSGCSANTTAHIKPDKVKEQISKLGVKPTPKIIVVDSKKQTLAVLEDNKIINVYKISTSKKGLGEKMHTFQTPRGLHRINEKIGHGVPAYGIFHRRHFTGSTWQKQARHKHRKDYISTRILRLEGLQPGLNKGRDRLGNLVDTEHRAVYLHGTTMEWKLGAPSTKGCVHMSAKDVIALFNRVPVGTLVWIN